MTIEFSRPFPIDRLGVDGVERLVEATGGERRALAARMGVEAVHALSCRFVLRRGGDDRRGEVLAEGELRARVQRDCVVTLEPFEAETAVLFRLRLVRAGSERDDELDPEDDDEIPYEGGAIDLGEAAAEQLALELDPYPRSPGARLDPAASDDPDAVSPFAALRRGGVGQDSK